MATTSPAALNVPVATHAVTQTATAARGKQSRFYHPELDAIRFFLFVGVFFHHAYDGKAALTHSTATKLGTLLHLAYGMTGFCLSFFFLLSSYLITCLLRIEKEKTGNIDMPRFYTRRMLRLWPLYVGYLLLIGSSELVSHGSLMHPALLAAMLLFTGNWYLILHPGMEAFLYYHLWSISVEEQFYVLFPFAARRLSPARLQQGCIAICCIALATCWVLAYRGNGVQQVWGNSIVESLFFASGALFALRSTFEEKPKSARKALLGILGGLLFWGLGATGNIIDLSSVLHPWPTLFCYAAGDIGCVLMLWGTLQVPAFWLPRSIVYLGRVAYGLYVFHILVITLVHDHIPRAMFPMGVSFLIAFLLTIAIGILSYEFFEKPFLRLKHRFELVHSRTA